MNRAVSGTIFMLALAVTARISWAYPSALNLAPTADIRPRTPSCQLPERRPQEAIPQGRQLVVRQWQRQLSLHGVRSH